MLRFPSPSLAVSMVALVVALGGAGYSATGGNFILGQINTASTQTRLVAPFNGAAVHIANLNAGANASGLRIVTDAARPPMFVNSAVRVANLNADKLDGVDASGFVQGGGIVEGQVDTIPSGSENFLGSAPGGFLSLRYTCPPSLATNGQLAIVNDSSAIANLFVDSGTGNPSYTQLASGSELDLPALPAGDSFSIQAQGALGIVSIQVATVHRNASNDCHAQALFVLAI